MCHIEGEKLAANKKYGAKMPGSQNEGMTQHNFIGCGNLSSML